MHQQLVSSVFIGLLLSAVLFLPLTAWQYRRFGRFDGLRLIWSSAGFTYLTGLIAFTIFPLPSSEQCTGQMTRLVLSPWRVPEEIQQILASEGVLAALASWTLWEAVLNVILLVPFGLIARRVFEAPRPAVFVAAVTASLAIEATQYTGNWGLAPCPYRVADITDLLTNSSGAALGILLERITPRLLSSKEHLLAHRDKARPVNRGRRLLGMVFDMVYIGLGTAVGGSFGAVGYMAREFTPGQALTPEQMLHLQESITAGAWTASLLVIILPAMMGNGASLGQRTVYLAPADLRRRKHVLRAFSVQGVLVCAFFNGLPTVLLVPFGIVAAFTAALITPRGLSYTIASTPICDSRAVDAAFQSSADSETTVIGPGETAS